ncbi:hypothetical protein PR202_gb15659 [Eleusine coracana subsp. coracana]|uniref:Dof zinc finger protein n=1 Tax=Eleusine coracana subsp. coracana TaxID=191504 RepID=A0AAV5EY76_ELECO|nr:hypothetical protein PR202_gb15659 [Eleusine coracana subsp. coracana]
MKHAQARWQATAGERKPRPEPDQGLRCPRCDSSNTKFCYYNNYNTLQPRYFCKACRRYWTQGGSLRDVPVGGGCRKNKRSSAASSSSFNSNSTDKQQQQQQHVVRASPIAQDFPNVLPTFMSSGFNLPPFALLPLPSLTMAPALTFGAETPFLDMLKGGFFGDHHNRNDFYGPTSSGMEHGMVGDHANGPASISGGGGAADEEEHWPMTQVRANQQEEGASEPNTASAK